MGKSLADRTAAITILRSGADTGCRATTPCRLEARRGRAAPASRRRTAAPRRARRTGSEPIAPEHFYRDLVWNLRNGVIAVTGDGSVAVMNDVAYRILGLKPGRRTSAGRTPTSARISRTSSG